MEGRKITSVLKSKKKKRRKKKGEYEALIRTKGKYHVKVILGIKTVKHQGSTDEYSESKHL